MVKLVDTNLYKNGGTRLDFQGQLIESWNFWTGKIPTCLSISGEFPLNKRMPMFTTSQIQSIFWSLDGAVVAGRQASALMTLETIDKKNNPSKVLDMSMFRLSHVRVCKVFKSIYSCIESECLNGCWANSNSSSPKNVRSFLLGEFFNPKVVMWHHTSPGFPSYHCNKGKLFGSTNSSFFNVFLVRHGNVRTVQIRRNSIESQGHFRDSSLIDCEVVWGRSNMIYKTYISNCKYNI